MLSEKFWRDKKVFITGHTGFKGSWLSLWLNDLGANVYGYALCPLTEPNLYKAANVEKHLQRSWFNDICDLPALQSAMLSVQPDIVIHLAAQALVRDSYEKPVNTYATNVMGTVNVLEAVRGCKSVRAVLVITSDKCYENKEWLWGYKELDRMGGYDPYSNSKACAELVVDSYRRSFFVQAGVAVATARAGNVIGGGDWAKDRLIPDCLRAVAMGKSIHLRNPQAIRPWQHVLEPLNGYLMLIERLFLEGQVWAEGWNFGPQEVDVQTVEEIVQTLNEHLQFSYAFAKADVLHEANILKLDCTKATIKLGWHPCMHVAEAVKWIAEWFIAYQQKCDMEEYTLLQIERFMHKISGKV